MKYVGEMLGSKSFLSLKGRTKYALDFLLVAIKDIAKQASLNIF